MYNSARVARFGVSVALSACAALLLCGGATGRAAADQALAVSVDGPGKVVGPGIDCAETDPDDCVELYDDGTQITLTAVRNSGATFTGWSGDPCSGTGSTCTITMNGPKAITASFTGGSGGGSTNHTLSVTATGGGSVTGPGIDCGSDCSESFPSGTTVTLSADPGSSTTFTGWGGACSGSSPTCTVVMDAAKSVTATFSSSAQTRFLSVTANGNGKVTGTGIDCGNGSSDCVESYTSTTTVTLTASPTSGATFAGWSSACSGTTPTCTVSMDVSKSVTATFTGGTSTTRTLAVSVTGNGRVTGTGIDCGSSFVDCSESYSTTTTVTLTAAPVGGASFLGWGGSCSGTTTTCTVTMDATKNVIAAFSSSSSTSSTLTVTVTGSGVVTAAGIKCGSGNVDCSEPFTANTSVTLTATPNAGASFVSWGGACLGTSPTCTLVMSSSKSVTATFGQASSTRKLTVSTGGAGKVTGSGIDCGNNARDCSQTYATGSSVTLVASPANGATFLGWGGACSGTATTCTVVMDGAKAVSASFSTVGGGTVTTPTTGGGLIAKSLGSPLVISTGVGWAVTLRFHVNQGSAGLLRLLLGGRLVNAFTFSPRAGDVLVGPFQLGTAGRYHFSLNLSNGRGETADLNWNLCLSNSGCSIFTPPTFLRRLGASVVRVSGGWNIRVTFNASRAGTGTVVMTRGRTRETALNAFGFPRGRTTVTLATARSGPHKIVLTGRDSAGRRRSIQWFVRT